MPKKDSGKIKWLEHEASLLMRGELENITHKGASCKWLWSKSSVETESHTLVYRPMGDLEVHHLLETLQLPSTQPYQAIIEGTVGRTYSEKYLRGHKKVDTKSSTVVEFLVPRPLIKNLFDMQHKVEDGAMSMGLGDKAGKGLPLFNESLSSRDTTWRIVLVKRRPV
jgi:hypothetical protein